MKQRLNNLDMFAINLGEAMIRLRFLVIVILVAAIGYIGTGAQNLSFTSNYRVFFSKENPELQNFENLQQIYTKTDNISYIITPKEGGDAFTRDVLAAVITLTEGGWSLPYSARVDSLTNFQYTYAIGDELIVEDLMPDPSALSDEELEEKRAIALSEPLLRNQLLTADSSAVNVNVTINYPETSPQEVPETASAARALRDQVREAHPNLNIYMSGSSMLNTAFSEAVLNDLQTLVPGMFVLIFVAVGIAVRSFSMTFAVSMVVALSTIAAMGWAGFVGIELAGPSPSATVIIMTLAVADSIHILMSVRAAMRRGNDKHAAIVDAVRVNLLPVTITSLTTAIGFLALNFSDSPPFRDLGNITAVGIVVAWVLSLTLLPALISILPFRVPARPADAGHVSFMEKLGGFVVGLAAPLFLATAALGVWLTLQIPQLELTDNFRTYFDRRIEFRQDSDATLDYFGFYPVEFSIPAGEPGDVNNPAFLKKLDAFTKWAGEQKHVTHVYSMSDIMKRLNKNMNGDDPAFYRLPEDKELAAQYLLLFELSLPYGLDLNDRINIEKSATRVTITFTGSAASAETRTFLNRADDWFTENAPEHRSFGTGPTIMFAFIAQRNVESMVKGTTIAVIAIAVIMTIALRSVTMGLLSIIPNAVPILAGFGVWALLVGEIGFSVAAVASLSLGIVIDDTTHFLAKYVRGRRDQGLDGPSAIRYAFDTVGSALVATTTILLAGFMLLMLSAFKINFEMGALTSITIAFALFFDMLLLPGLLLLISRASDKTTKGEPSASEFS